jgi:PAS domain S-box-containing protein
VKSEKIDTPTKRELIQEISDLKSKLTESQETLRAIQSGEIDAIVINSNGIEQIYTLKGAEEPYRILFEQMNEGAITISDDRSILYCNHSFAELVRTPLDKIIGTDFERYVHPSDKTAFRKLLNDSIKRPGREELMLVARDGYRMPVQLSISAISKSDARTFCMIAADLKVRIQAEADLERVNIELEQRVEERTSELESASKGLQETSDFLEKLLDNANAPIIVWDPSFKITKFNHAFEHLTEYVADEVIGRQLAILFPEETKLASTAQIRRTIVGEHWESVEIPIKRKDGTTRTVLWNSATIFQSGSSQVLATIAQGQDITGRKRTEEMLKEYSMKLENSNEELQQFAYVASHDLQEPLRMVSNYLSLLDRNYKAKLDPKAQEYINIAVDGGERMHKLITDLLEYSRVGTQGEDFVLVDMNAVAAKTIEILKAPIEETKAEITLETLPSVVADESQMVQVMQNLIGNALKFHGPKPPRIIVSASQDAKYWTFAVKDNGIGLNMQYADKIFMMFERLHNRGEYPGTGIGLAITKKIIERHGGRIRVVSEEGKGATFLFTIPTTEARNGRQNHS